MPTDDKKFPFHPLLMHFLCEHMSFIDFHELTQISFRRKLGENRQSLFIRLLSSADLPSIWRIISKQNSKYPRIFLKKFHNLSENIEKQASNYNAEF